MTVPSAISKHEYVGNSVTTEWPWSFILPMSGGLADTSVIKVYLSDDSGVTQLAVSDYDIDRTNQKIVYPKPASGKAPIGSDTKIILLRVVPELQLLDLENQGHFKAEELEAEYDSLEMQIQQIREETDRSVKVPLGSSKPSEVLAEELIAARDEAEAYAVSAAASALSAANSASQSAGYVTQAEGFAEQAEAKAIEAGNRAADATAAAANAAASALSAANSAAEADDAANRARALVGSAGMYDPGITYVPGDACITSDGQMWRCVVTSTGEDPRISTKWAPVLMVDFRVFELDGSGDLMPVAVPTGNGNWEIDGNGDIMPI